MLSLTQELTSFVEIERAVEAAVRAAACSVVEFSAGAEVGVGGTGKGRYQLFVEFDQPPADPHRFAPAFDESLCAQNRVYREHRTADVAILPPGPLRPAARGGPALHGGHWPEEPAAEVSEGRREF